MEEEASERKQAAKKTANGEPNVDETLYEL